MLVDSHCHLNFPDFKDDFDAVLKNAKTNGVTHMLTVNTRLNEAKDLQKIADAHDFIYCSVGVHPHDAKDYPEKEALKSEILDLIPHEKVIALGETGLDYYYNNSPKDVQIQSFETHIDIGATHNLPIIIHTRDADDDTISTLKNATQTPRGVFHCFSGDINLARKALDLGFYLSFSGIITFKKAESIREAVKFCPMDRFLVETDSPFLAPIPHRGQRNEPAFTRHTAEKVAEIKGISFNDVAKYSTENFCNLFNVTLS